MKKSVTNMGANLNTSERLGGLQRYDYSDICSEPLETTLSTKSQFAADGLHPRETIFRRPGRPKQDWLIETYRDAYKRMYENMQFERVNAAHLQEIKERATQRLLPF